MMAQRESASPTPEATPTTATTIPGRGPYRMMREEPYGPCAEGFSEVRIHRRSTSGAEPPKWQSNGWIRYSSEPTGTRPVSCDEHTRVSFAAYQVLGDLLTTPTSLVDCACRSELVMTTDAYFEAVFLESSTFQSLPERNDNSSSWRLFDRRDYVGGSEYEMPRLPAVVLLLAGDGGDRCSSV